MSEVFTLPQPFEELDHTADVGLRVYGNTAQACLARLVLGFTALTLGGTADIEADASRPLEIDPGDFVSMAVDVLRELLYVFDTEHRLPARCTVHRCSEQDGILLELAMAPIHEDDHEDITDLKAVTWHDAAFEPASDGWTAQVIFDV